MRIAFEFVIGFGFFIGFQKINLSLSGEVNSLIIQLFFLQIYIYRIK